MQPFLCYFYYFGIVCNLWTRCIVTSSILSLFFKISKTFLSPSSHVSSFRSSHRRCSVKNCALKNLANFTGKHLYSILFFNKIAGLRPPNFLERRLQHVLSYGKHLCQSLFLKKETLPQVFSCEFCEIFKNTFFTEHLWMAASELHTTTRS